jgi:hypothetical protein
MCFGRAGRVDNHCGLLPALYWTTRRLIGYKRSVKNISRIAIAVAFLCCVALADDFTWDWHNQEVIGRNDPSLSTTSKLTEPERNELLDAIISRLLRPLTDAGYSDDRIREIALTTKVRFVDLGEGKPVVLAESLGIEGGCDVLVNCPFWIFRHTKDGYVSLLDTVAASYTVQATSSDGYSDMVIARHTTPADTKLTVFKYADGRYSEAGCYMAIFAPTKEGEGITNPAISPCGAAAQEAPKEEPKAEPPEEPKEQTGEPAKEPPKDEVH